MVSLFWAVGVEGIYRHPTPFYAYILPAVTSIAALGSVLVLMWSAYLIWTQVLFTQPHRSKPRVILGLGVIVAIGVLLVALPAAPDPGEFPAGTLWEFRLSSLGTQLVLWTGLGVIFGLLSERANRQGSSTAAGAA